MKIHFLTRFSIFLFLCTCNTGFAIADTEYLIQPGDNIAITVWKEDDLKRQVFVRPDGRITFPLAGEITAGGSSVEKLKSDITRLLTKYIPNPLVTVSVTALNGNQIYVIGKVNQPGVFTASRYIDVVQALSMAGGTSTYAALNKIKILRRENGELKSIKFSYSDIEKGKNLDQNIILKAGDVVMVP